MCPSPLCSPLLEFRRGFAHGYLSLGLYQVCDRAGLPGVQSELSNTLSQASAFLKFWCTGHWYTRESWCAFGTSLLEKL